MITRTETLKKHYHYEKKSAVYIINKNPCDSTIYILLSLQSWTTSCIFYNAETQQHHASQIRRMQLPLKTIRKRLLTVILISSGILH